MLKLTGGQLMGMRNAAARVSGPVYQILKGLGFLKLAHRGVSAGQRRRRRIEVIVTQRTNRVNQCTQRNVNNPIHLRRDDAFVSQKPIILELINIRSVNNKADLIHERIIENDVRIMAITETWLKESDKITEKDLCPPGQSFLGAPRPASKGRKGDGLGFVIAPTIRASRTENDDYETFEALSVIIKSQPPLTMALIYRPPPLATNQLTRSAFLAEFEEFLSSLCSRINGDLCVLGDFNIHWDDENDSIASRFHDILAALDMKQHVHVPTHTKKHTLDLVLTRMQYVDRIVLKDVVDIRLCDHFVIACDLVLLCYDEKKKRQIMSRSLKRVDVEAFAEDLGADLADLQDDDLNDLGSSFNRRCLDVTNAHAPLRQIILKDASTSLSIRVHRGLGSFCSASVRPEARILLIPSSPSASFILMAFFSLLLMSLSSKKGIRALNAWNESAISPYHISSPFLAFCPTTLCDCLQWFSVYAGPIHLHEGELDPPRK
ncbi:hypothetical protein CAPTEDRAFT_196395 [Capitella teleta]|uniref:Endonuclease/exonuclease/phosphatase domain-containing protein n=1 Tax=Capitella teleta TaxID=283909 RepID=R7TDE6_CAPTE|nr:hypothetical protein CAPTEDRAFT_196395 [Capitella teleta]|eukprot:ELT89512.1 hypothetical protein CAPTEDRAFT_196395 [Capitella teleta]